MGRPSIKDSTLEPRMIKFLCSYGGKIIPRYTDGKLRYLGGSTRILAVHRSISFSELQLKLGEFCGMKVNNLRCQLPTDDLDALVSITSDEDIANLTEEYDKIAKAPSSILKIKAFLLPQTKKISSPPSSMTSSSSSSSSKSCSQCTIISSGALNSRLLIPSQPQRCLKYTSKPPVYPKSAGKVQHYGYATPTAIHSGNTKVKMMNVC